MARKFVECVLPQNEDAKNAIEMADEACRNTVQKNGSYPTAHCEDVVTTCQRETTVGDKKDELTEPLLYSIAKVISGSIYSIAIALEVPISCIPDGSPMRIDNTMECLKIWRGKQRNATALCLMEIVKKAVLANDVDGCIMNYHIDAQLENSPPTDRFLLEISSKVVNRESFIIGHLGLTETEYVNNPLITKRSQIMKVLRKWRQEHSDNCSVTKFLEYLQKADTDVVYPEDVREIKRLVEGYQRDPSLYHTDVVDDGLSDITTQLTTLYRNQYAILTPMSTQYDIDDVFVNVQMRPVNLVKGRKRHRSSNSERITLDDVLVQRDEEERSHTILINGVAGSGKSTLCERIAYQWAKKEGKIKRLQEFSLVILVKLYLVKSEDTSIFDYIKREYAPSFLDENNLQSKNVLFILDGYDNLVVNQNIVLDLLKRKTFRNSTIIVTARHLQAPSLNLFTNAFDIVGLKQSDVKEFLTTMSRLQKTESIFKIDLDTHPLGSMLTTPLYLWIYVGFGEHLHENVALLSRTLFYKRVVSGILNKAIYRLNKLHSECEDGLNRLRKIAFECLLKGQYYFSEDLTEVEKNLGYLKIIPISYVKENYETEYKFIHSTFLEFLGAQYIVKHHGSNICATLKRVVDHPLVITFICGLLTNSDQLKAVFDMFVPKCRELEDNENEHDTNHYGLQAIAEIVDIELSSINTAWIGKVQKKVALSCSDCSHFCELGLYRMVTMSHPEIYTTLQRMIRFVRHHYYNLKKFTLQYSHDNVVNTLGQCNIMHEILKFSNCNVLGVSHYMSPEVWEYIKAYYGRCRRPKRSTPGLCPERIYVTGFSSQKEGWVQPLIEMKSIPYIRTDLKELHVECREKTHVSNLIDFLQSSKIRLLSYKIIDDVDDSELRHLLTTSCSNITEIHIGDKGTGERLLRSVQSLNDSEVSQINWKTLKCRDHPNGRLKDCTAFEEYVSSLRP